MPRPAWITIPNLVTLLRVALTPFILLELARGHYLAGGWLFGAAATTDILDGWLARHFAGTSKSGQYLDPVADKLLLTSIYIGLAVSGAVPVLVVIVIFARDLWILVLSAIALRFTGFRDLQPSRLGKVSTFAQVIAVVAITAGRGYENADFTRVGNALLWVVVALAFLSGAGYTTRGINWMRLRAGRRADDVDLRVRSE
jgi:cardiolipin synthase